MSDVSKSPPVVSKEQDIHAETERSTRSTSSSSRGSIFNLPRPLKRIFDQFPLITYPSNPLPQQSPIPSPLPTLYIFTNSTPSGDITNTPAQLSFNPACLKWQTYLTALNIPFQTCSSNNHASPSGILPFLLLPNGDVITAEKMQKWADEQSPQTKTTKISIEDHHASKSEIYSALLDCRIRRTWLYQLYLHPANAALVDELYIKPVSRNGFVDLATRYYIRSAAMEEIRKTNATSTVEMDEILQEGRDALRALSELLGKDEWFFGSERAELFDASVFAYTHLLLDDTLEWGDNHLGRELKESCTNLVQHRERMLTLYDNN